MACQRYGWREKSQEKEAEVTHLPEKKTYNVKKWTGFPIDKLNIATQERGAWKDISHVGAQSAAGGESE